MNIQSLTEFFMWCTIINAALLVITIIVFISAPDFIYSLHSKIFPISREAFDVAIYMFLGLFKIVFLVFNAVPYAALLIIRQKSPQ